MTKSEIITDLRELLKEFTDVDVDKIGDDDLLFDEWGLTSVIIVQLFVSCQDRYGISMQDEVNMQAPVSLSYVAEAIEEKLNQQQ